MAHNVQAGRVKETRRRSTTVALLEKRGRFLTATPFFERGRRLVVDRDRRASPGDLVLLRTAGQGRGHAKIARRIGRPDVARDVLEALMLDRGLARALDPEVEREAEAAASGDGARVSAANEAEAQPRRDLRTLPTFTIDPVTASDFDDAVSAEDLGDGHWRVWVHIADVAAHVPPGSALDREAYRRGTSVYVPGTVEPMLPAALSSDACSLVPEQERAAVTVELDLEGATVQRAAFYRSLIRSDVWLDYDRVDRIFAGQAPALEPWAQPLAAARAAAAALAAARASRRALELDSSEPEFSFDDEGHVIAAKPVVQTESHRVIEHLMIAANEQVATLLEQRGVPALYRVHEPPEPTSVERLVEQLASLDVPTPPLPEHTTRQQAAELVGEISQLVEAHVRRTGRGRAALSSLVLRALKQAHYSPRNVGHTGLKLSRYCHFTSPIRRYPDLVCHRALLSAVSGTEPAPQAAGLDEAGTWASTREREAMEIERDADDVALCFLLERELFEQGWTRVFEGEVVGLAPFGAFVAFGGGFEGLLAVRRLRASRSAGGAGGEWWELNQPGTILHGTRTGKAIRLGDPVHVQVQRVDAPRGRVDLDPVNL